MYEDNILVDFISSHHPDYFMLYDKHSNISSTTSKSKNYIIS